MITLYRDLLKKSPYTVTVVGKDGEIQRSGVVYSVYSIETVDEPLPFPDTLSRVVTPHFLYHLWFVGDSAPVVLDSYDIDHLMFKDNRC